MDDGSTDNSRCICKEVSNDDKRFKYIYKNWKAIYHEQVAIWLLEHKDTVYAEKFYTGVNKKIKENSTGKLIKRY